MGDGEAEGLLWYPSRAANPPAPLAQEAPDKLSTPCTRKVADDFMKIEANQANNIHVCFKKYIC